MATLRMVLGIVFISGLCTLGILQTIFQDRPTGLATGNVIAEARETPQKDLNLCMNKCMYNCVTDPGTEAKCLDMCNAICGA